MKRTLLAKACVLLCLLVSSVAYAQVTVTATSGTPNTVYTTLGGAATAINNGTHTGVITITLTASTVETASVSLDSSGNPTGSSYTSILIQPAAGTPVTISGSVAGPLINLNGADNVTIDGFALAPGGATLTIDNVNTAATASTIALTNDATSNTIKNTTLKGAAVSINTGVLVFGTGLASGNDNNNILNNNIDCNGLAAVGIYSSGSNSNAYIKNSNNNITNCWIHDFFNATLTNAVGVYLPTGNTDWTLSGNSLYQSVPRTLAANTVFYGMFVSGAIASDKHTITGNFFGGSAPGASNSSGNMQLAGAAGFTPGMFGFYVQTSAGTLVSNNTVRNISFTSQATGSFTNAAFYGYSAGGNVNNAVTFSNNTVADILLTNNTSGGFIGFQAMHMNGRATVSGISASPSFILTSNTITNITATTSANAEFEIYGIRLETSSGNSLTAAGTLANPSFTLTGNNINSITVNTTGTGTFVRGIGTINTNGTSSTVPLWPKVNITSNTIRDIAVGGALASYTGLIVASGIHFTGSSNANNTTDVQTISLNTIYNVGATTTSDVANHASGIIATLGVLRIEQNKVYGIYNTAAGVSNVPIVSGINLRSALATSTIANNFVSLGAGQSTNTNFFGILNNLSSGNPIQVYYNSVYLTGIGGTRNSVAFYRGNEAMTAAITTSVDLKDNIFYNFRSGGTGKNYAVGSYGTSSWISNYNVLFSVNPATTATWNNADNDLATYKTNSGGDANSLRTTVNFVDPANGDLHLAGASVGDVMLKGTPIAGITIDYDNQNRSSINPYMGADEANIPLPVQMISFTGLKENQINRLMWSTSSETNNKGFELQRSADGRNFSTIAFIATKAERGNSSSSLNYSFSDEKPFAGTNYYRLKQIDNDARTSYSSLVTLKGNKNFSVSAVYPNPAKDEIKLSINADRDGKITYSIIDITGKILQQKAVNLASGNNNLNLNIAALPAGLYQIRILTESGETRTATAQFVKN
jgi:hypothetical protein